MRWTWIAFFLPVTLVCVLPCCGAEGDEKAKTVDLLADGSLDGWNCFLVDPNVKQEDVWSVKDGVLICKGEPLGYLYTKQKFTNFKLSLQWRWAPGAEPGNSGVLLRITGDAISFLPKCAEAQLKGGSAGDVWGFYGFNLKGDAARMRIVKDHEKLGNFQGVGRITGTEKEPGQWNTYEITFHQGQLTVAINGEKVNEATDCDVVIGHIGLQSEGGEIHFRNIKITEL
jgi:hypothetical protein